MTRTGESSVGVVFDLDGTLIDSEPFWMRGFSVGLSQILRRRGYGEHDLQPSQMSRFLGARVPDTLKVILDSLGLDRAVEADELAGITSETVDFVTREFVAGPVVVTEAVDTARALHQRGVALAVASSSALPFIDAVMDVLGLDEEFPVRVSAFDFPVGKPDPAVYLAALERMRVPADRALAVEDSPVGVASALNADLRCLWFRRTKDGSGHAPEMDWRDQLREVGGLAAGAEELVDVSPHLSIDLVTDSLAKVLARGATR